MPTSIVYKNYQVTQGEEELYIVKGAGRTKSSETDPQAYIEKISIFLKKYER